jgi:hypothetical protein
MTRYSKFLVFITIFLVSWVWMLNCDCLKDSEIIYIVKGKKRKNKEIKILYNFFFLKISNFK